MAAAAKDPKTHDEAAPPVAEETQRIYEAVAKTYTE